MLTLNTLKRNPGETKNTKRLGRGPGSGQGGTAGKGHKGQLARSGGKVKPGFEGGQTPLYRRLPKRGFKSLNRDVSAVVNLWQVNEWPASLASPVTIEVLRDARLVRGQAHRLVILGTGEVTKAVSIRAHRFSGSAAEKISKAGGKAEVVVLPSLREKRLNEYRSRKTKSKT